MESNIVALPLCFFIKIEKTHASVIGVVTLEREANRDSKSPRKSSVICLKQAT